MTLAIDYAITPLLILAAISHYMPLLMPLFIIDIDYADAISRHYIIDYYAIIIIFDIAIIDIDIAID
jgi:hypothetical protein